MRDTAAVWLVSAVLVFACAGGQTDSEDYGSFWRQFSSAVVRNSESEVRDLTRFPFLFENRPRAEAEFGMIYASLFDQAARECIGQATPVEEGGNYVVFCGPIIYVFAQDSGGWRFSEFTADPEAGLEDAQ